MPKSRTKHLPQKIILIWLFAALLLLPNSVVLADTGPTPPVNWFTFEYQTSQRATLQGVQIIGCESLECQQPVLLQQFGICQSANCLSSPPPPQEWDEAFECIGQCCRSALIPPDRPASYFKLAAQFSDRTRASQTLEAGFAYDWGSEKKWLVTVQDDGLVISPSKDSQDSPLPINTFLVGLVLTQLVELAVAAMYLRLWLKNDWRSVSARLLMIFLVNLATFTIVWFFFPSLGQFQLDYGRAMGLVILVLAVSYAALMAGIYRSPNNKVQQTWIGITIFGSTRIRGVNIKCHRIQSTLGNGNCRNLGSQRLGR